MNRTGRNKTTGKEYHIIFCTEAGVMRKESYPTRNLAEKAKEAGEIIIEDSRLHSKVKDLTTNWGAHHASKYLEVLSKKKEQGLEIDLDWAEKVLEKIYSQYQPTRWTDKPILFL